MELDAELELMLTPRIRNVVVYGLGLLIHQLVVNRCTRAEARKALCAPGNIHNRKAAHRRRRIRSGNKTKFGVVRLAYLRRAFGIEIHESVAVPPESYLVHPGGIWRIDPNAPVHLRA